MNGNATIELFALSLSLRPKRWKQGKEFLTGYQSEWTIGSLGTCMDGG